MILADVYDALNHLWGKPIPISEQDSQTRAERDFQQETVRELSAFSSKIGITADDSILIVGCGDGAEIDWFSKRCKSVVAIDVNPTAIDKAEQRTRNSKNVDCRLVDGRSVPFSDNSFDLIFMHNVCEHIMHIEDCFAEYYRVLKNGKYLVNYFAPLFYSAYGAHLKYALKLPWGHLLFGLRAVNDVRNRYYPEQINCRSWTELGLNRITERRYRKLVKDIGFRDLLYVKNISKNLPLVVHVPYIRNLFILGIHHIAQKKSDQHVEVRQSVFRTV